MAYFETQENPARFLHAQKARDILIGYLGGFEGYRAPWFLGAGVEMGPDGYPQVVAFVDPSKGSLLLPQQVHGVLVRARKARK